MKKVVSHLPDVASEPDRRGVALHAVGIRGLRLPIRILGADQVEQVVVALADLSVDIEADQRGTHMSRLVSVLYEWSSTVQSPEGVRSLLQLTQEWLQSRRAHLKLQFPYFLKVHAPATQSEGLLDVEVAWECGLNNGASSAESYFAFPAMTLCPCSKEISDYGAHNQRAIVRLWLRTKDRHPRLPDAYLPLVRDSVSALVYPILKRPDEKYVTERSYETPRFVEDVVRELVLRLQGREEFCWFRVECESIESIHNHNAFALYEAPRTK
ncbi:MAG: GTP cyclohydrolase I FolE2 [Armatimonadota bacterium]